MQSGDSQIFIDLPWNIDYDQPIIRWEDDQENDQNIKVPILGKYSFIATAFVKNNGNKIEVKETINCDIENFNDIMAGPHIYVTDPETGWRVPQSNTYLSNDPLQSDTSVNVNINLT